jgi:diguanylate cyclase (GGDEF)-like protein
MQDNTDKKVTIIDSIKHKAKLLDKIVLLIIFSVFFINIKVTSTVLDYIPSTSIAFLLFIVSILVAMGFYLARKISLNAVNSLVEYSNKIRHNAYHDSLTKLPNRALFEKNLEISFARAKRNKDYVFAVLFLDIDRFKMINDSLGHMMGDQLLITISQTLQSCLRANDFIARLGGDEFAILLDDIKHVSNSITFADRIYKKMQLPFTLNTQDVFTSVSIGIALSDVGYDHPQYIMRDADTAMYRAKSLGRARHVVFDVAMYHHAVALLKLDTDLRRAIERQEFLLHYQPIVSIKNGKITGFEALIRWNHPKRGMISPAEFIPVAEENRLIIPIGQWVLREACRQMQSWHKLFPALSVNISSKQFSQPDLIEQIKDILFETGLDARSLSLEITESVIMENPDTASDMLMKLRDLNIQLYIDDFGTGYSSLSYLSQFHADALKIDRSFINKMLIDEEKLEIVRAIMSLADTLKMSVIAEGVETEEHLSEMRRLKCEYAQGYFFSKPLDATSVESLIQKDIEWLRGIKERYPVEQ